MLLQVLCSTRGLTLSAMPRVTGGLDQIHKVKSPLPESPKIPDFWDQRVEVPKWELWTTYINSSQLGFSAVELKFHLEI